MATNFDLAALVNSIPSLGEAALFAWYARDMQARANVQIAAVLATAENARGQQRADFLDALHTEREERRNDNVTYQQQIQTLSALVSATNALVMQREAAEKRKDIP